VSEQFYIGQIWRDRDPRCAGRELVVEKVEIVSCGQGPKHDCLYGEDYIYLRSTDGRATRISAVRLRKPRYEAVVPAGRYVGVLSESGSNLFYNVWTGDDGSPAHCPCEDFRFAAREPRSTYLCKHLKFVLYGEGMG